MAARNRAVTARCIPVSVRHSGGIISLNGSSPVADTVLRRRYVIVGPLVSTDPPRSTSGPGQHGRLRRHRRRLLGAGVAILPSYAEARRARTARAGRAAGAAVRRWRHTADEPSVGDPLR